MEVSGTPTPLEGDNLPRLEKVTWYGPSDPSNTHNLSLGRYMTLLSGPMLAPALDGIGEGLKISVPEVLMTLSIFLFAFASGSIVPVPLMVVLVASTKFEVSSPSVMGCWNKEERGKSYADRGFLPLLGPNLGLIVGGVTVQELSLRWLFWIFSIVDLIVVLLLIVFLPESNAQTILSRTAAALRNLTEGIYYTKADPLSSTLVDKSKVVLTRPYRLLSTQPMIELASLFLARDIGLLYIALSIFSSLWTGGMDRVWARRKERNEGQTVPEHRVPLTIPGALLIPISILWYC
ncbi:uncharacterized protein BDR25DRAFT_323177 [Lindgomyces ingoldianus]|uniref:Uncharacterized protein n=1 Tax=Lindgomyces ingoldianus TaxID=673940 RepID=A0ACB6R4A2_9PLEO|nr:uncharacterized protein BDR25DRAFT_323177 [Lindgomyces ingoldianus]KAF2474123.1 hypothetical protein BDR25DRAFT_323177 [Lindgomyces ingoldianus]